MLLVLALLWPGVALATGDPLSDQQWHLGKVRAAEAWSVSRGEGVVVAVIDTGVDASHPDLQGRLVPGRDFIEPGTPPDDVNGHGTLVAGIVAAVAGNGVGGAGVAPRTSIMPVRVLDPNGRGNSRDVADGIRWAVDSGAQVVNLSLTEVPGSGGGQLITTEVEAAIREATNRGVLVVGAAGNDGRASTPYRSGVPVLVVGASDRNDQPWAFSNRDGQTLFAPGVEIVSTYTGGGYARAEGTSFAAPIVSAGAALLRKQGFGPEQIRQRLIGTSVPIGAGFGRVDLAAAVGAGQPPPPPTTQPPPPPQPEPPAESAQRTTPSPAPREPTAPPRPPAPSPAPATTPEPTTGPEPTPDPTSAPAPVADPAAPEPTPEPVGAPSGPPDSPAWPAGLALVLLVGNIFGHAVVRNNGMAGLAPEREQGPRARPGQPPAARPWVDPPAR